MEVLRGVHLIRGEVSNIYLIETESGNILVDTGTPNDPEKILSYLRTSGLKIELIFVTHAHWDHVGGLKAVKEFTGARVATHVDEAPYIRGEKATRRRFEPVDVDVVLRDGDSVLGLTVIHTPGHTPGSSCLFDSERRMVAVGDLVYEEGGEVHEMLHQYSRDPYMNRESIAKLLLYDFDHLLPSHGNPVLRNGREKLKLLVESFRQPKS
ncbi:MAG: MBL fold metallo-hydrolase [Sulfolobales archaeon]